MCQKPGHFAAVCKNQYCQRCGKWGHNIKSCYSANQDRPGIGKVGKTEVPEETVIIEVKVNVKGYQAMLEETIR